MRRLVLVAVPALLAGLALQPPARAQGPGILIAAPFEGHSGDWIYLTGYNLPPNQRLNITMACPYWWSVTANELGNRAFWFNGPTTDANGALQPYRMRVLSLHSIPGSGCQIYVNVGANDFGPDFPALFTILPKGTPAVYCATHICISVKSQPSRVRAGSQENISIVGNRKGPWPGATADITVTYADHTHQHMTTTLDMTGSATVTLHTDAAPSSAAAAHVRVHVHLGVHATNKQSTFTVVR